MKNDVLKIGDQALGSRLFLGTGKFSSTQAMIEAVKASGTELVTVALRRFNRAQAEDDLYGPLSQLKNVRLMPNTSGAMNAKEAVRAALLGRELSKSPFVKLEIHPNPHHLLPDPIETYEAAIELVKQDFLVLPYIPADPVLAKRLEDVGCAAVMPLGAAIGTGKGLSTAEMIKIIIRDANVPVVVPFRSGLRPRNGMRRRTGQQRHRRRRKPGRHGGRLQNGRRSRARRPSRRSDADVRGRGGKFTTYELFVCP